MVTKEHRGIKTTYPNKFYIIGSTQEQIDKELKEFIKEHGTEDNHIMIYQNNTVPNKENLRPEFSYEVIIVSKEEYRRSIFSFYKRAW